MNKLDDIINEIEHLPPLLRNLPKLITLLDQPDIDSGQVVRLIEYDPAFTANVMRLCNSAYVGVATPVNNLQEAVICLGFNEVFQLLVALSSAKALLPQQKGYGIQTGELWKHAIVTAQAAKYLAQDKDDDANLAFTAAMLHDIGKIVLAQKLEPVYAALITRIVDGQSSLLEAEKELLGVQHAEIGGRLLERWQFSPSFVRAVWNHHDPLLAQPDEKLAAYIYLGNMIAYSMGFGYGHQAFAMHERAEALKLVGLASDDLPQYVISTFESLPSLQILLDLHF
ncbi:MAG: HDOD domain-containing protein [Candidatus Omnitrophica bacterium]|nr:HDOD domain-containing protein [Candidatus Omnitrophota bacterium]